MKKKKNWQGLRPGLTIEDVYSLNLDSLVVDFY